MDIEPFQNLVDWHCYGCGRLNEHVDRSCLRLGSRKEVLVPLTGCLIAESLRVRGVIDGFRLTVTKVSRMDVGNVTAGQPRTWTFIDFEAADEDAERLASVLEHALLGSGGWYCDFRSNTETFVVFANRSFRYQRGNTAGRSVAADYARSAGVPEEQIDWPE